ncbi:MULTISPECIES: rhomboid family intramembrane serine protease [unclassified Streptomyces]|uniref:rhomboid family intramembrane serine protease n=1 Tax=unclassified Streptomyces TaxID=2593676 RepID=UPI00380D2050
MTDQAVRCYRHPDRETGIRCSRCERPICPECMVNASVGFHCPECVRDARRETQATGPRTVAGGSVAGDPRLVTKVLIGLNLAVFLLVQAVGDRVVTDLALLGAACDRSGCFGVALGADQWYRLISSMFLHQELWHIGFNMLSLWWIGAPLEGLLGRARYIALYLISGLGGGALVLLLAAPNTATLGASGAIFGLFGATAVFMRRLRYDMRPVLILLGLNLVFTFFWAGISWQAHIGGLVAGSLVAVGMAYAPRERRALVQWGTAAAVLAVVLVVAWVGVAGITG